MATFDRLLIDPTPEEWDSAFAQAVTAANARFKTKRIGWPLPGLADFVLQLLRSPDGMRGWHGGTKPDYWEGRSQVVAVWWSDRLGRKHVRILGGAGKTLCHRMRFRAEGIGMVPLSPLEQVYPAWTARCAREGPPRLLALCDCGAVDEPDALGWMGTCCGPCHDRRGEGEAPQTPLGFSVSQKVCHALAFSPDSQRLALSQDGVWVRDLGSGNTEKRPSPGDQEWGPSALAFSPDGRRLVLVYKEAAAIVDLDTETPELSSWSFGISHPASDVAVSPDARLIAFSEEEKGRVEIRAANGASRLSLTASDTSQSTSGLAFSPDGKLLATACFHSPLRIWDTATGRRLHEFADTLHPTEMAFTADGALLAGLSILHPTEVRLWDLVGGEELPAVTIPSKRRLNSLTFAPTGRILVAGGDEGMLFVWDLDAPESGRLDLQSSEATTLCLASSPDGRWLAVGDNGGGVGFYPSVVRLWPWPALRSLLARS